MVHRKTRVAQHRNRCREHGRQEQELLEWNVDWVISIRDVLVDHSCEAQMFSSRPRATRTKPTVSLLEAEEQNRVASEYDRLRTSERGSIQVTYLRKAKSIWVRASISLASEIRRQAEGNR